MFAEIAFCDTFSLPLRLEVGKVKVDCSDNWKVN